MQGRGLESHGNLCDQGGPTVPFVGTSPLKSLRTEANRMYGQLVRAYYQMIR